jgi:type II secretory pathway pseudopilin PulG
MKMAFTLLELVFVIVVIGILGAAVVPRMERDTLYEAAEQLLGHIKYTQHLALVDDVYRDDNATWYKAMWRISFWDCTDGGKYYTIFSDKDGEGNADYSERARDPLTRKQLYMQNNCSEDPEYENDVLLSKKYGIENVVLGGGCYDSNKYVAFDMLGRPHYDLTAPHHLVSSPCFITLVNSDGNATITIEPETGYARITSIND